MTLEEIWLDMPIRSDKGDVHSYLPVYEELLAPYRHTAENVLEIGLFNGASMRLWERYFTKAKIYGIDCDEQPHGGLADLRPMIAERTHNIAIGDAEDKSDIEKFYKDIKFDVIIEDAGHHVEQQLKIYVTLKPYLNKGGIYIIEDVQDIDKTFNWFVNLDGEIVDRRHVKNRYDDVLVIIRNK